MDSIGGIMMNRFYLYYKNNCVYVIQDNKVVASFKDKSLDDVRGWFNANIKGIQLIPANS